MPTRVTHFVFPRRKLDIKCYGRHFPKSTHYDKAIQQNTLAAKYENIQYIDHQI